MSWPLALPPERQCRCWEVLPVLVDVHVIAVAEMEEVTGHLGGNVLWQLSFHRVQARLTITEWIIRSR